MPRKFNDYYDYENKVQHTPEIWECPKCFHQVECLSGVIDVTHPCKKNNNNVTFYKKKQENQAKKKSVKPKIDKKLEEVDKTA